VPVRADSGALVAAIGRAAGVHADFGSGRYQGGPIGIPYTIVASAQPRVPVSFLYDDESDPGPYPIPPDAPIEGGAHSKGDRHVIVVDRDACRLYELFDAHPLNGGASWHAGSGAIFDLRSNASRPEGWTSADAAGLPIFPGSPAPTTSSTARSTTPCASPRRAPGVPRPAATRASRPTARACA